MRYLKTYKLFEASTIRTDKSFKSSVEDILADLSDEDIVVEVDGYHRQASPLDTITIRSTPIKMGFSESNLITVMDISPYLIQLISFLDGDYLLSGITINGWESGKPNPMTKQPGKMHLGGPLKDIQGKVISKKAIFPPNQDSTDFLKNIMSEIQGKDHYITDIQMTFQRSNSSIFKYKLDNSEFHLLHDDSEKNVVLDKYLNDAGRSGRRIYYINFKNSKIGALKLVYDLNSRRKQNFKVYDNYNTEIDFNKLEVYLMKNNMSFGVFNDAWHYIEDNFNNQGYTN